MSAILSALARKLGDYREDSRGWYHFECPWDIHSAPKLGIHLETMRFNCISCHKGGAVSDLLEALGIHIELEAARPKRRRKELAWPPSRIPHFASFREMGVYSDTSPEAIFLNDVEKYVEKCGRMTWAELEKTGWGYCTAGRDAMRLIVPVFMDKHLVSYLARSIYDFLEPKELAGPLKDGWWPRDELCYGLDSVLPGRPLVLVEGLWDRRHLRRCVPGVSHVSMLGSHLSAGVCGRILAKRPSRIILFLDGDDAGRAGTTAAIGLLRKRKYPNIYAVRTEDGKDPDDYAAVEAVNAIETAGHWMKWRA